MVGFNFVNMALLLISYKINKNKYFLFHRIDLNNYEKIFLAVSIFLLTMSLFGAYLMQLYNNNILILLFFILVPIYIAFATIYGKNLTKVYPLIIVLIAFSLQIVYMLRFSHITGKDVHYEYFYFKTTLNSLQWNMDLLPSPYRSYDVALSINILPAVYQILSKFPNPEYFFKGFYVIIFSFAPLAIYKISKKYIDKKYAFLASFLFMSQYFFMKTAASPRTNLAVFFVALFVMVLFDDKIGSLQTKIISFFFLLAIILSHYTTAYLFFILIAFVFILSKIFSQKIDFTGSKISLIFVILCFTLLFFWYGQATQNAFTEGINFIGNTISGLNNFFLDDLRDDSTLKFVGIGFTNPILQGIYLLLTWIVFISMGAGVLISFLKYKEYISLSHFNKKFNLYNKIDIDFALMSLIACFFLASSVLMPYISKGYDLERLYLFSTVFLSFFFILGIFEISELLKLKSKKHIIILLILIPFSLYNTGAMYEIMGHETDISLVSSGMRFDQAYVSDAEIQNALWISNNINNTIRTTSVSNKLLLISQGLIYPTKIDTYAITEGKTTIKDFVFISNFDLKYGINVNDTYIPIENYSPLFNKSNIYDSGLSLVYI
jgi:uncharacterized membrane protein